MGQKDTKKRILDAAERLFAREGFHSTSLRMLTKEAGVNLAAVNYHFGSKEELINFCFQEVGKRSPGLYYPGEQVIL
jgi:AcrR family transcriptional regulator